LVVNSTREKIGSLKSEINKLNEDNHKLNSEVISNAKKVEIEKNVKVKIDKVKSYINILKTFLENQKNKHKDSLQNSILEELKSLMHKLSNKLNSEKFINSVVVTILPNKDGMKIDLNDQHGEIIRKESLSSGEKQIYISCLIKAIINESVESLPIFIDTPLGRLDEEHRDNLINTYYSNLSEQVVLFSTDSEITPERYKKLKSNISHVYLLENNINTTISSTYFEN